MSKIIEFTIMRANQSILYSFILLFAGKTLSAQPGALDPTFGIGGQVSLHPSFSAEEAKDIAIATDGKILLLSSNGYNGSYLMRVHANGVLDSSFGDEGILPILQNFSVTSTAIEIDSANSILLLTKYSGPGGPNTAVYRFLENGAKDSSFGYYGKKVTAMQNVNRAMIIQADHKIVVAGQNNNLVATVERFNVDGSNDNSFHFIGSNSLTALPNSYAFALQQQQDGKLLATGTVDGRMFVARFTVDGDLDTDFNGLGYIIFSGSDLMAGQDVEVMPDGKILVVGHGETSTDSRMLCWRLLSDGSPDYSFGTDGIDTLYSGGENNFAWFAFANEDSTAIVGGEIFDGLVYQPIIYRIMNDGSLDNGFGINGIAGKTFDCGRLLQITGVRTADGKIIYCGTGFENGNNLVSVSQFLSNGLIDSSFANNGSRAFSSADTILDYNIPQDFTVLPDGKIFCIAVNNDLQLIYCRIDSDGTLDSTYGIKGYSVPNQRVQTGLQIYQTSRIIAADNNQIFIAQNCYSVKLGDEDLIDIESPVGVLLHKMDPEGIPDSSFGAGGILRLKFPDQGQDAIYCTDVKLQADGKLLFAQQRVHDLGFPYGTVSNIFLTRYDSKGNIDSTFATDGTQSFYEPEGASPLFFTIRNDGKINCLYGYQIYPEGYIGISRLLNNGSFDSTFGVDGTVSFLSDAWLMLHWLLQSDNKMLFSLSFAYGSSTHGMYRYDENGIIDSSFANNGFLDLSFLDYGPIVACELQSDDKILACNATYDGNTSVARFHKDGAVDFGFGTNGLAKFTPQGNFPRFIRLQPDGKILISQPSIDGILITRLLGGIGTSIDELADKSSLQVYPNPTSDQLMIRGQFLLNEEVTISIYDLKGKTWSCETRKYSSDYLILLVENLPDGVYMVTIRTENDLRTQKFVKQ